MTRYRKHRLTFRERISFNPEIGRGLLAILLFILGGLSTLSFFSMAGIAGQFIDSLLSLAFGQVRFAFPLILIIVAILLIKDLEYNYRSTHLLGALIFFLSFNGLVHLQKPLEGMINNAWQGYGGGLVGLALAWPCLKYVGFWGGTVILAGLMLVAVIFLFNTSLARIVELNKKALLLLGWTGKQVIAFFSSFRQNAELKFKINGDYQTADEGGGGKDHGLYTNNKTPLDDVDNDRTFKKKNIASKNGEFENEEKKEEENIIINKPKISYKLPPLDILYISKTKPTAGDVKSNAAIIKDTLLNFGIEVEMGEVRIGPTVAQYSLKPAKGIKLTRITSLSNDLALALAAHPIRIEAPIPGKSLVGIEVPNQKVAIVSLRELLESPEFKGRKHNMMITLGKDVAGKVWFVDLPKMPHLLIAGATGSGKTACINTIILSLLYQNTPNTLRLILVDPKRVEFTVFNGIPHLLTPVITEAAKTINALKWTIGEMEKRFNMLAKSGNRDIDSFNSAHPAEPMPHIVFIIDELADLMAMAASEVEAGVIRVAQMARAVGIHLIVATQRPSVEIITGLIKANIPGRLAFSVASIIDSRTILDCSGAEKLLGRGDMLFLNAELSKPKRLQGAFVSEEEMKRVVDSLREEGEEPEYDESITTKSGSSFGTLNIFGGPSDDQDPLFEEAKHIIIESGKASASLLQRRLRVGYARAARLLDELEETGIVGPVDGAKPREVFVAPTRLYGKEGAEVEAEEQIMDAGGTVFDEPLEESLEPELEEDGGKETTAEKEGEEEDRKLIRD